MRTIGEIKAALAAHPEWEDDMAVVIERGENSSTIGAWGIGILDDGDQLRETALILTPADDCFPIAPAP